MVGLKHQSFMKDGSSYSIGQQRISSSHKGFRIFTNKETSESSLYNKDYIELPQDKVIKDCKGFDYVIHQVEKNDVVVDYMKQYFYMTNEKETNSYSISMRIPLDKSSKPEYRGEFIVVVKGYPSNYPRDNSLHMYERYMIKVTDCSNGELDVHSLDDLKVVKRVINNRNKEISFKDSDIKISGVDGCGGIKIKKVGIVSQVPTLESTEAGHAIMK